MSRIPVAGVADMLVLPVASRRYPVRPLGRRWRAWPERETGSAARFRLAPLLSGSAQSRHGQDGDLALGRARRTRQQRTPIAHKGFCVASPLWKGVGALSDEIEAVYRRRRAGLRRPLGALLVKRRPGLHSMILTVALIA
jgi:hypothetical protein